MTGEDVAEKTQADKEGGGGGGGGRGERCYVRSGDIREKEKSMRYGSICVYKYVCECDG